MRYLLDFSVYAGGGSSTYADGFLDELATRPPLPGGCVVLLPADQTALARQEDALRGSGYTVYRPSAGRAGTWRSRLGRQFLIPLLARRFGSAVVFIPRETAPLLLPARMVILARNLAVWRRSSRGVVAAARFVVPHVLGRASAARARVVLATTQSFARDIRVNPRKLRVVHHGCDLPAMDNPRVGTGTFAAPLTVICLGGLAGPKRYDVVIRAVGALVEVGTDARLALWGSTVDEDETARLRELSRHELGYDAVRGLLPADQRLDRLAESDVLGVGSSFESFGLGVVEAMRTATLVWAPESELISELCGGAAVTYREGDHLDAATRLIVALPETGSRIEEGHRSAARFTWANCVERTLEALVEATGAEPMSIL